MQDYLFLLSLIVINTRSYDVNESPTSPPFLLSEIPLDTDDLYDMDLDEDETEDHWTTEAQYFQNEAVPLKNPLESLDDDDLIERLEGLRYSGVGLFANEDRNVPWKQMYSNLRLRGKRSEDLLFPWQALYSLRGKKTVANLPWHMGLQSPMLRGKKSVMNLPWRMRMPMVRGKKTKTLVNLPWNMDLKSPMLRGKKASIPPMPWRMSMTMPMLRGKKELLPYLPEVVDNDIFEGETNNNDVVKLIKAQLPWHLDYLSPMMRG